MTIGFNKFQFYGKIIFLTIAVCIFGLFIYFHPIIRFSNAPIGGIIMLIIVWALLVLLTVLMTLQLFFWPNGIEIDNQNKTIIIKFLSTKSLTILPNDITEFCSIVITTKSASYEGVLIRLKNGKEYPIGDFNLKDFRPVQTFLEETKVAFAGHYKFNSFSYFFRYFRQ